MFLVRYIALAALAVWIGGAVFLLIHPPGAAAAHAFHLTGAACGAAIVVSLFFMKFIGPPPHAFPVRATLAAAMTLVALSGNFFDLDSRSVLTVTVVLGMVLLTWYAKE